MDGSKTQVTDESVKTFAPAMTKLKKLVLKKCGKVTDGSISLIAEFCHSLQEIDLSECPLINGVGETIAHGFHSLLSAKFDGCFHLSDGSIKQLAELPLLRELNLSGCERVSEDSLGKLREGFPSLRTLTLHHNKISDSACDLFEKQRSDVKILRMSRRPVLSNSITNDFAPQISVRRLEKELKVVLADPLPCINAHPIDDNLFVWHANLYGAEGTSYEGGIFHFELEFVSLFF